ncbi:MAG: hypothetical protein OHK0012_17510 [Synechococcales cyanobacterium]
MVKTLAQALGVVMLLVSLYFIGDEISFSSRWWGIPASSTVLCLGLGFWGLFSRWPRVLNALLIGAGVGLVFYNSRIWMNPVTLRELIIALSLGVGGLKLLTLRSSDLDF